MPSFSVTEVLIASDAHGYQRATQSPFLQLAAHGRADKAILGEWLANDRLYIHSYIRAIGRLLGVLQLSARPTSPGEQEPVTTRLVDWLVDALVNIRREERFFVDTAARYGINVDLRGADGLVRDSAKLEGLRRFETLFGSLAAGGDVAATALPWLEAAVVLWGTERCYLDAWSWARAQLDEQQDGTQDADGGALRNEFISNWTGTEFVKFVENLGEIIDEAVATEVEVHGDAVREELLERAKGQWSQLLQAEEMFWPVVEKPS